MSYVELHCRSNFSFLRAASHPDELVQQAAELGYAGIAITDRHSIAGVVRGFAPASELGIQYIVGAELHPVDAPSMVVWPTDRAAYGRLCRLLSRGRMRCEKGQCRLHWSDIVELNDGLLAGVLPDDPSSVWDDEAGSGENAGKRSGMTPQAMARLGRFMRTHFRDVFGDRGYLMAELHQGVDDDLRLQTLADLALRYDVPLVASGGVAYHTPDRMLMHDCVTAIRLGKTIAEIHADRYANSQRHLKSLARIRHLYREQPRAVSRTLEIAQRCQFRLSELRYEYPEEIAPSGMTMIEHLKRLTWEGAKQRWPGGVPDNVLASLKHEIQLIEELKYEAYFLTVWDMVRFARSRGILCQGRGSAANSSVCYCLGITAVDPGQGELLFERFISRERNEAPDIDVDFEHQRREEVLQYLYEKYGRDRAGMTATVTTYRGKSAIREVGKALGASADAIDTLAKLAGSYDRNPDLPDRCRQSGIDPDSELGRRWIHLVMTLIGFPRHLSQHVGGMVMTAGNLCELCVIENAAMPGRTVIQWDKDDLDELGILKVDVLSLGMLSAIRRAFELVHQHHGRDWNLANLPPDDPATYDMICRADTVGVFQIESRAQMSMLPRLKPKCYYDLVIEVAIVRPGPIQGNMVHPFLQARENPDAVVYPNDAIRKVLEKTLGVPIFQEQAMKLAVVAAGFTPGEADQLRRAMAAWRRPGIIDKFRIKLLQGMTANGLTGDFAEQVFRQIRGFGEYGFPESHAASFALLVYASAYLKCHYPAAFCAALLNSQPMGFYAPAQLIADARNHGVTVRPPDVNHSQIDATLEDAGQTVRLGLRSVRGLAIDHAERLIQRRPRTGYRSMADLTRQAGVGQAVITRLADADALQSICGDRRAALWQSLAQEQRPDATPLFASADDDEAVPESVTPMGDLQEVYADYEATGLSLKGHPIAFVRRELDAQRCVRSCDLPRLRDGRHVRVAGLVLMRQRPATAKGITFVTIEDETGPINLVMFADVWKREFRVAKGSNAWMVDGKLENRQNVIHVIVGNLTDLSEKVTGLTTKSRDFR
ncbi:error-prone DNA polymerase [Crateriforma conspicua]|uniref:Error-prone DNA polymerase n=1 Tax=Crateriforma conspicua TaxID=2527996 RepID=A0A5C5Y9H1_9PLAN|nr:error-prone DNA polymerase [Crateriforma conspicua]TWT72327.1 Error-prone DNA polymerase [Crateriforma conspicua]